MLHKLVGHYLSEVMLYIIDRIIEVSISAAIIKYIVFGRIIYEQSMHQWPYHKRDRTKGA